MLQNFLIGTTCAALLAVISFRVKFLTLSGSIATFILAVFIFGLGEIKWSVPILTFFIFSSILSKLRKGRNEEVEAYFEKSGVRDYLQVLANGGLGGVFVILYFVKNSEIYYLLYISTLAAVCADTWATEVGTLSKHATYNILNFKPIIQGTSGGISMSGTIGAITGALLISLSGFYWIKIESIVYFPLIVFAGLFGSLFDSFLGATVQAQYKCEICKKVTEKSVHCGKKTKHYSGLTWINNDVVNFLCSLAGGGVILFLNSIVKF